MTPAASYAVTARACAAHAADPLTLPNMRRAAADLARANAVLAFGSVGTVPTLSAWGGVVRDSACGNFVLAAEHTAAQRPMFAANARRLGMMHMGVLATVRGGPLPWSHEASARLLAARVGA